MFSMAVLAVSFHTGSPSRPTKYMMCQPLVEDPVFLTIPESTGWRLGYVAAPAPIIKQTVKIHQYTIMCSPTISQYAAIQALQSCDEDVRRMVDEYNIRRRYLVERFNEIGLPCFNPEGAFYVFPCIRSTGMSSEAFCEALLNQQKVAVVPGNAFGDSGEGFVRVSYAYSLKHLMMALDRSEAFLASGKAGQI